MRMLALAFLLATLASCGDDPSTDAATDIGQDTIQQDTPVTPDSGNEAAMSVGDAGMDAGEAD